MSTISCLTPGVASPLTTASASPLEPGSPVTESSERSTPTTDQGDGSTSSRSDLRSASTCRRVGLAASRAQYLARPDDRRCRTGPRDIRAGRELHDAAPALDYPGRRAVPRPTPSRCVDPARDLRHCRPRLGARDSEELFDDERPPKPNHGNGGIACAPTRVIDRSGWTR